MMKKKVNDFLYEDLSYKIRGCAFNVYNTLGFGHKENIYQAALKIEFEKLKINFGSQKLDIRRRVWTPDYQRQSAIISENQ